MSVVHTTCPPDRTFCFDSPPGTSHNSETNKALRREGGQGSVTALYEDTRPEIERLQIEEMRQAPAWRKLAMVGQLNDTVRALALSGLRQRNPLASPEALRRMLADLLLGEELAARVYGPIPDSGGRGAP